MKSGIYNFIKAVPICLLGLMQANGEEVEVPATSQNALHGIKVERPLVIGADDQNYLQYQQSLLENSRSEEVPTLNREYQQTGVRVFEISSPVQNVNKTNSTQLFVFQKVIDDQVGNLSEEQLLELKKQKIEELKQIVAGKGKQ